MSSGTLRKWIRQAEVDKGKAPGVTSAESQEIRELRRKNRELEQAIEILKAAASFSRGSATRDCADLSVYRRGERGIRGRTDLPGACSARPRDRRAPCCRAGKRELRDTAVTEILAGIYEPGEDDRRPPESLYWTVKMWAHLNRQGIPVAECTVERLKRAHGWRGVTRGAGSGPPCRTRCCPGTGPGTPTVQGVPGWTCAVSPSAISTGPSSPAPATPSRHHGRCPGSAAGLVPGTIAGDGLGTASIPLLAGGTAVGSLTCRVPARPLSRAEERLLHDLARQHGGALHARLLREDLQRARERLVLSRGKGRRRLRRHLYDSIAPALAWRRLNTKTARALLLPGSDGASRQLRDLSEEIRRTVVDVRRLVEGLRPRRARPDRRVRTGRRAADSRGRPGGQRVRLRRPARTAGRHGGRRLPHRGPRRSPTPSGTPRPATAGCR
jgi:hypothetical protein